METLKGTKEGTFVVLAEFHGKEQSYIISLDNGTIQQENEYIDTVMRLKELTMCETGKPITFQFSYMHSEYETRSTSGGVVTAIIEW